MNLTRPFVEGSRRRSWWHVGSTLAILIGVLIVAGLAAWWPLRLAASVVGGLVMVRSFILYHDFMHGSILRSSPAAKWLLQGLGMMLLAPPRSWRESHNYHHANVAKLNVPSIGSYPIMTTAAWRRAARGQRFRYRLSRHPLTILGAYLTVFALTLTVQPLLRDPRRNWDSALALGVHGGVVASLWVLGGAPLAFFAFLLPYAIAAAMGAYLFYAQHNFPGLQMLSTAQWNYYRAALESSSYMRMGSTMRWFLGNIGHHHVHHLNPAVPCYRLPEAMAGVPELQQPMTTSLRPRDVLACLQANLWDEEQGRMVSYRQAAVPTGTSHPHEGQATDLVTCLDCQSRVSTKDRVYAVGCEDVLCLECSLRRGGRYDDSQDRWIIAPAVEDLLPSLEAIGQ